MAGCMPPTVVISARGESRLASGHPWIYRTDVVDVRAAAGDVVVVHGPRRRPLGRALFSDQSQIALRLLSFDGSETVDDIPDRIRERIDGAIRFREALAIDGTAYRLVHGE